MFVIFIIVNHDEIVWFVGDAANGRSEAAVAAPRQHPQRIVGLHVADR